MLLIPAIDLKDGRCVRLWQGQMDRETVFSEDPVAMAERWVGEGARRLHVIDLDGAVGGEPRNREAIRAITEACGEVPVQVGGGIRDEETIEDYLALGVQYVILGTRAVTAPHFVGDVCTEFPGHILVALDARDGRLAVDGWSKLANHDLLDLARRFESDGVEAIIHTDIGRDGTLDGVNVEATVALASELTIPVIAAGGIRNLEDVRRLCEAAPAGIMGAITGRAIYEGTLDFREASELAARLGGESGWDSPSA